MFYYNERFLANEEFGFVPVEKYCYIAELEIVFY